VQGIPRVPGATQVVGQESAASPQTPPTQSRLVPQVPPSLTSGVHGGQPSVSGAQVGVEAAKSARQRANSVVFQERYPRAEENAMPGHIAAYASSHALRLGPP
jgi:hypothetical protein